jgi:hypothetical protein
MRTYYHLSYPSNRESIFRNGLRTGSKSFGNVSYENKLFLFSDREDMPWRVVGGDVQDLWEVKIPDDVEVEHDTVAYEDGHKTSWKISCPVPPENIRYIKSLPHPDEYCFFGADGLVLVVSSGPIFPLEPAEPFTVFKGSWDDLLLLFG